MYKYSSLADALEIFIANSEKEFSLEDALLSVLQSIAPEKDESEKLRTDISEFLDNNEKLFKNIKSCLYFTRSSFLKDKKFCVTPCKLEIESGILFPGHRFAPFCETEIIPSEIEISDMDSGKIGQKEFSARMDKIIYAHFLLGSEQMMNFLMAENKDNFKTVKTADFEGILKLDVFDMEAFYKKHSFKEGDALIFSIDDWDKGIFSFQYKAAKNRSSADRKKWARAMDEALEEVFEDSGFYLEIPEQLSQAFFKGNKLLLNSPDCSFEEFYELSESVKVIRVEGRSVLGPADEEISDNTSALPEGVSISSGNTDSIDEILKETGCPLNLVEIESYILAELYEGSDSYQTFFENCLGGINLTFADEAQKLVFENFLEDLWERLSENYNRFSDEDTGRIRLRILEITGERREWFEHLKEHNFDPGKIPSEKLHELARISEQLRAFLRLLNSGERFAAKEDIENVTDAVEQMGQMQEELIEELDKKYVHKSIE